MAQYILYSDVQSVALPNLVFKGERKNRKRTCTVLMICNNTHRREDSRVCQILENIQSWSVSYDKFVAATVMMMSVLIIAHASSTVRVILHI